ncbi:MAG: galactokinase [Firmicutes bacterium]|nr:galactokinase [Bacillota bacterium]MBO2521330.1 galactokinase [Bacillota bacterium]
MDQERTARLAARCVEAFQRRFDPGATFDGLTAARAPGRVNLIGEHTDYNDGFVFPMAIDREVVMVGRRRADDTVRLYSVDYDQESVFELSRVEPDLGARWSDYVRGVVQVLQEAGFRLGGFEAAIAGDVPRGAGLSSSAALEVSVLTLLDALFDLGLDLVQKARYGQRAENQFVGVACGIMDQFVSAAGKAGHGLFLDCRSLDYQHVPLHLEDARVLVIDTRKSRELADSAYNARRQECQEGAAFFARRIPEVRALRDVTPEAFAAYEAELPEPVRRRCRHVVTECQRVLDGVKALAAGDLEAFGRLMNASHASLRDDYEVSCRELDLVVEIASGVEGVYGARMTGAGFGGCAVALVHKECVEAVRQAVCRRYPGETGLTPEVYEFTAAEGAGIIDLAGA